MRESGGEECDTTGRHHLSQFPMKVKRGTLFFIRAYPCHAQNFVSTSFSYSYFFKNSNSKLPITLPTSNITQSLCLPTHNSVPFLIYPIQSLPGHLRFNLVHLILVEGIVKGYGVDLTLPRPVTSEFLATCKI